MSNSFQYYLLPSTTPPPEYLNLHNRVFEFWCKNIQEAMSLTNNDSSHIFEDFVRQDVVSCICHGEDVLGVFLYSFFNFQAKASSTLPYFKKNYNDIFFQKLKKFNVKNIMSTHYLVVDPNWRKSAHSSIRIGLLLAGLSNHVRDEFGMDAGIGPTRTDIKVADLFYAFGGDCLVKGVMNHNTPCDLVANIHGRTGPHADPLVNQLIDELWENRIDLVSSQYSQMHHNKKPIKRVA